MRRRFFNKHSLVIALIALQSTTLSYAEEKPLSSDGKLVLRRIAEFWKEGEYEIAKAQILDFLEKYPTSSFCDQLYAMLGDVYFKEGKYDKAADAYDSIQAEGLQNKTAFNLLQSLFEIDKYQACISLAEHVLKESEGLSKEKALHARFLLAESLYRQSSQVNEEEKAEFLRKALPQYKMLVHTKYGESCLFPMAEIHFKLGESAKSAALFVSLADKNPKNKEDFLFQAASLYVAENKEEAIAIFKKIHELDGKKAKEAAFNALVLLYETSNFKEFVAFQEKCKNNVPREKEDLVDLYLGKSFFALGEHDKAFSPLEKYVDSKNANEQERRSALLTLIISAKQLNERPIFDRSMEKLLSSFPKDEETAKALILHAQLCRERGDSKHALDDLNTLLLHFPNYEAKDKVLYDMALLHIADKNWTESRFALKNFIKKYPEHAKTISAWRHLINCSMQDLISCPHELVKEKQNELIATLKDALQEKKIFSSEENKEYRFLLIKSFYESENYQDSFNELTAYVNDYPNDPTLGDAYLLMGLCSQKIYSAPLLFIEHAEKALASNPELNDNALIHLHLYNEYLRLTSVESEENIAPLLEKAADHLFACFASKKEPIKMENQSWLASFYYKQFKSGQCKDISLAKERAYFLLTTILTDLEHPKEYLFKIKDILLENEALKLAELFEADQRFDDKIALLESLTEEYKKAPDLHWKSQRFALFELAKAYEAKGEVDKAIAGYDHLIQTSSHVMSYISDAAMLQMTRLQYSLLPEEQKMENNPQMIAILTGLKDLQIKRKIYSEPIHIEAALDYADIKAKQEGFKLDKTLFLMNKIKEDFAIDATKEHSHPDKEALLKNYLKYVDAEILRLSAIAAQETNEAEKAKELLQASLSELTALQDERSLTPYLQKRIEKSTEDIKGIL